MKLIFGVKSRYDVRRVGVMHIICAWLGTREMEHMACSAFQGTDLD